MSIARANSWVVSVPPHSLGHLPINPSHPVHHPTPHAVPRPSFTGMREFAPASFQFPVGRGWGSAAQRMILSFLLQINMLRWWAQ